MRSFPLFVACAVMLAPAAQAQEDFAQVCRARSSYDLTIAPDQLLFDRAAPAPRRIELRDGRLRVDGAVVRLNTEDGDRLALFERELRQLVPKIRTVAQHGVDLALQAVRLEAAGAGLGASARADLDRQLAAHGAELRRRIATSTSTHDWQGDALDRYGNDVLADLVPVLAADLGQQAVSAAVSGDVGEAAALQSRAARLGGDLAPRLQRRMQALRPQIAALCPSVRHLAELQRDVRGADGRALDLVELDGE